MNKKLNANFVKLVKLLNDGCYHDGTTIGDKLKMTRSAVWKTIKKLEHYKIRVESIKGTGYALLEPLILLDAARIKKNVSDINLHVFESIDSTGTWLKNQKLPNGIHVCIAEQQTNGRGRFNRVWHSPFARNIYLSSLYPFQKDISELSGLSLVTSLAVLKSLKNCGLSDIGVKWPNDIVYRGQKLSGSLIEIQAETHGSCQTIIGLGINVNMLDDENIIQQSWTSMQKILGKYVDRNLVCIALLNNLFDYLSRFEAKGLAPFIDEWNTNDSLARKKIALSHINETIEGRALGINEQGHLLLELKNGKTRTFSSGDTSVAPRGIDVARSAFQRRSNPVLIKEPVVKDSK